MVSKASDDLPLPLKPVTTTSLSRGIWSVRFLRLCSRAPPMRINSLLTVVKFQIERICNSTSKLSQMQNLDLPAEKIRSRIQVFDKAIEFHSAKSAALRAVVHEGEDAVARSEDVCERVPDNRRHKVGRPLRLKLIIRRRAPLKLDAIGHHRGV